MKKAILGLFLSTMMVFGAGVTLTDSNGTTNMPVAILTNITVPHDIRNNIVNGVYAWTLLNSNTTPCYVEFFDSTATTVILGTTVPVLTLPVQSFVPHNLSLALPIRGYDLNIQNHNFSVAAVTTPNGTTPCTIGITGMVVLTNN